MARALGKIAGAAQEARALIAAGDAVVGLDPSLVEASFIVDRVGTPEESDRDLVVSIRDHGQQVPILVRPHPTKQGHYQAAYGHRRLRAAAELKQSVRAVVKDLTDTELVIAQGQENSARLDLSYIERALFSLAMEKSGIERTAIMAALNVEKTQLSRLLAIARTVPQAVVQLIGSAPKTGRPRWAALIELLEKKSYAALIKRLAADPDFISADSDNRFARFYAALAGGTEQAAFQPWQSPDGQEIARYKSSEGKVTLVLDDKYAPEFGAFVISQLETLYERYRGAAADRE
jgi:ParB family chromosome partitioning protein